MLLTTIQRAIYHVRSGPRYIFLSRKALTVGKLFEIIRVLVIQERYIVGQHAAERLEDRGVLEWQVVDGIETGSLIVERPDAAPNPAVEVRQTLANGTDVKVVWSHLSSADVAKLVTVHFFDE